MVIGLYSVVWGKSKDEMITSGEGKAQELPVVLEIKNKSEHVIFDEAPASNSSIAVTSSLSGEP